MRRIVFWDVDTQVDFIEPNGKLPVPDAVAIKNNLLLLTSSAPSICTLSGSVDAHTPRDREFKSWPEHCVYGTPGQRKIPESTTRDAIYVPSITLSARQLSEVVTARRQTLFEKQEIDVETNPNTRLFLAEIDPEEVAVYGVAVDVCVDHAVRYMADKLGYKTTVILDAIRGIDPIKTKECLNEWRNLKVGLEKTEQIIDRLRKSISSARVLGSAASVSKRP
jgi:nicotinamidase/pyrazinamidase